MVDRKFTWTIQQFFYFQEGTFWGKYCPGNPNPPPPQTSGSATTNIDVTNINNAIETGSGNVGGAGLNEQYELVYTLNDEVIGEDDEFDDEPDYFGYGSEY